MKPGLLQAPHRGRCKIVECARMVLSGFCLASGPYGRMAAGLAKQHHDQLCRRTNADTSDSTYGAVPEGASLTLSLVDVVQGFVHTRDSTLGSLASAPLLVPPASMLPCPHGWKRRCCVPPEGGSEQMPQPTQNGRLF